MVAIVVHSDCHLVSSPMTIAICLCTCDRPQPLRSLLDMLAGMALGSLDPNDIFLVVVDNQPDGRAQAICDRARQRLPVRLHFVEELQRGISFARNRALATALARGADFIAFIDDDDLPHPNWLLRLIDRQQATGADLVFGPWRLPDDLNVPAWLSEITFFKPPRLEATSEYDLPSWAGTYNVLISRTALEQLQQGGQIFRPEFALIGGEDTDLFIRARSAGLKLAVAEDSVVIRRWDATRVSLRGTLRRAFFIGVSSTLLRRRHLSRQEYKRRRRKARIRVARLTVLLPLCLFQPKRLGVRLHDLARLLGALYSYRGKFSYYR
jgi:succinoglycan biosynthesis protein ExoM